ncbi:MAG: hypothetical protein KGH60_01120 [Candidatus Micrarchaeota archaeon]|nr:hypothetical protein [Candidatus Micrarchaeota archaeon]
MPKQRYQDAISIAGIVIGILLLVTVIFFYQAYISHLFGISGYSFSGASDAYGILLASFVLGSVVFSLMIVKSGIDALKRRIGYAVRGFSFAALAAATVLNLSGIFAILYSIYYSYAYPSILYGLAVNLSGIALIGIAVGVIAIAAAFKSRIKQDRAFNPFIVLSIFAFIVILGWAVTANTMESLFGIIEMLFANVGIAILVIKLQGR